MKSPIRRLGRLWLGKAIVDLGRGIRVRGSGGWFGRPVAQWVIDGHRLIAVLGVFRLILALLVTAAAAAAAVSGF